MFKDVKPSHLALLFLSGAFVLLVFVPIVPLFFAPSLSSGAVAQAYSGAAKAVADAGLGETLLGLAIVFFLGIFLDGMNVICHESTIYNRLYRWTARLWGYEDEWKYINEHPALSARLDDPDDPKKNYVAHQVWLRHHPEYHELRSWEAFLTMSFDLMVLSAFWYVGLMAALLIVMLLRDVSLRFIDFVPLIGGIVAYALVIPGAIFHRYIRTRTDSHLSETFLGEQKSSKP